MSPIAIVWLPEQWTLVVFSRLGALALLVATVVTWS